MYIYSEPAGVPTNTVSDYNFDTPSPLPTSAVVGCRGTAEHLISNCYCCRRDVPCIATESEARSRLARQLATAEAVKRADADVWVAERAHAAALALVETVCNDDWDPDPDVRDADMITAMVPLRQAKLELTAAEAKAAAAAAATAIHSVLDRADPEYLEKMAAADARILAWHRVAADLRVQHDGGASNTDTAAARADVDSA